MNWLDIVIIVAIAWFALAAFSAGILREVVTLAATIGGAALAGLFYRELADDLRGFTDERTATVVAFLIIFASVALMGQLIASLLKGAASAMMLGWLDHFLGGLFGLAKGLALVELFFILFITYPSWRLDDAIAGSALAPFFLKTVPLLLGILPGEFRAAVEGFIP